MKNNTPPNIDLNLLKKAHLTTPLPMSIHAAKQLDQYDTAKIREKVASRSKTDKTFYHRYNKPSSQYKDKSNLELLIDHEFIATKQSLQIQNCRNFTIKGTSDILPLPITDIFFISIVNCHSFTVEGIKLEGGSNNIILTNCSDFTLSQCKNLNAEGFGLIIHNSEQFTVEDCTYQGNRSGIMVLGKSTYGAIVNCNCRDCYGFSNCDSGIHLCATSRAITIEQIPHQCHEPLPIDQKALRPQHILIENCTLSNCRSQGLYLEGAVNCLITNNIFTKNNKEGVCFDWGSCYNIFTNNTVSSNGARRQLTKDEIEIDFILEYPLLTDGSSSMKLPGISLDNGSLNLLDSNKIANNYGGGIKMVRSAILNNISNNSITSNAIGKNQFVPFFHGISLLGIGAINNEFTGEKNKILDFLPSILNTISNNVIEGHFQSIFHDTVSENNFISSNSCHHEATFLHKTLEIQTRIRAKIKRTVWKLLKTTRKN